MFLTFASSQESSVNEWLLLLELVSKCAYAYVVVVSAKFALARLIMCVYYEDLL